MSDFEPQSVQDAAIEWFVRVRRRPVSPDHQAAFRAWLAEDPAHRAAYAELERLWANLDQIEPRPAIATEMPARTAVTPGRGARCQARDGPRSLARRRALGGMGLVAAAAAGVYVLAPPGIFAEYRTAAGDRRTVTLPDGTRAHLNTATALSFEFADGARRTVLHAGEVFFEVAADPARRFVVEAGPGRVQALGTAFAVHRRGAETDVIVTEGRVTVAMVQAPAAAGRELEAGQGLVVTRAGVGAATARDTDRALGWLRGRLVFEAAPLPQVLAEVERYRTGRIVVMDSALAALPVTGSFSVDDSDAALDTIEQTLPVRLVRVTDLLVLVFADGDR